MHDRPYQALSVEPIRNVQSSLCSLSSKRFEEVKEVHVPVAARRSLGFWVIANQLVCRTHRLRPVNRELIGAHRRLKKRGQGDPLSWSCDHRTRESREKGIHALLWTEVRLPGGSQAFERRLWSVGRPLQEPI